MGEAWRDSHRLASVNVRASAQSQSQPQPRGSETSEAPSITHNRYRIALVMHG